jgi:hypothetical protein
MFHCNSYNEITLFRYVQSQKICKPNIKKKSFGAIKPKGLDRIKFEVKSPFLELINYGI